MYWILMKTVKLYKCHRVNGKIRWLLGYRSWLQSGKQHKKSSKSFICFCFVLIIITVSGWHDRKSERRVLPVWTLVNRLEAWENVKTQLWSERCCGAVTHCDCVCKFVSERQGERDRDAACVCVCACGTLYMADATIFISHSWRPRKCSVSWLTVIFSVSAWQRCADSHCHVARTATCCLVLWKLRWCCSVAQ